MAESSGQKICCRLSYAINVNTAQGESGHEDITVFLLRRSWRQIWPAEQRRGLGTDDCFSTNNLTFQITAQLSNSRNEISTRKYPKMINKRMFLTLFDTRAAGNSFSINYYYFQITYLILSQSCHLKIK